MSFKKQVILRYRGEGHIRFSVPTAMLQGEIGAYLSDRLTRVTGIYRVDVYPSQGKLSIRYFEGLTDLITIVRALGAAISEVECRADWAEPITSTELTSRDKSPSSDWIGNGVEEARETLNAAGIVIRRLFQRDDGLMSEPSKLLNEFFTDVLVLWVIKAHWHLITQHWLKRPWAFRSEWLASLYLTFLLVRSKKSKN